MPKSKIPMIVSIFIIFCLVNVVLFNYISDKQYGDKYLKKNNNSDNKEIVDEANKVIISEYNNVPSVDEKLGSDIKITHGYLKNYIINKQGIWYMSYGYVKSVKKEKNICNIELSEDNTSTDILIVTISNDKCNVKANTYVHFVGTLDIETGYLQLSKIDTEEINYNSVTYLSINDLINNINLVRSNNFIVTGYLVNNDNEYQLYDSKDDYDKKLKNYFIINFKNEIELTENKNVNVTCNILNSNTLNNCILN